MSFLGALCVENKNLMSFLCVLCVEKYVSKRKTLGETYSLKTNNGTKLQLSKRSSGYAKKNVTL